MANIEIIIIAVAFLAYLGYREWQHTQQVKDLTTKLMARTPADYAIIKSAEKTSKPAKPVEPDEHLIDPMEADPDEFLKGQEKSS